MSKQSARPSNKKAIGLTVAILAGLVLGALFGLIMPGWAVPVTSLISAIYLHALTMMIYPLVFCSLIVGIQSIGSVSATGKVGGRRCCTSSAPRSLPACWACFCPRPSTSAAV